MKINLNKFLALSLVLSGGLTCVSFAGNKDRVAQAGANELLLNPWARSTGFANANASSVRGLESQFLNVAGLAFTKKTELLFSNTTILASAGIKYNAFGFSQKVGKGGVMALAVNSLNFGQIDITTVDNPEGGIVNTEPRSIILIYLMLRNFPIVFLEVLILKLFLKLSQV